MADDAAKAPPPPRETSQPPTLPPPHRRNASETVTWQVRIAAAWAWRLLLITGALWLLAKIAARVELVAISFVLAMFFTAVLHPLERRINRVLRKPKSLAPLLALLIGFAVLGGIGYFVSWQISQHAEQLGQQLADVVDKGQNWLRTGPLHWNSEDLKNIADKITSTIQAHQEQLLAGAIETVQTVFEFVEALLLILLSTFFLLRDGEKVWNFVLHLAPRTVHERVDRAGRSGWHTLGGYMRGQVIIALFHGVTVGVLLTIMQVPLAGALGVLIFLGSFIPLIGLLVSGTVCVLVALLEHGLGGAIIVAVAIIILMQVEGHLLQPVIMSRNVAVHPLAIALAVITGATVGGIAGALLAVPFVAFLNTTVRALRAPDPSALDPGEPDGPDKPDKPDQNLASES